MRTWLRARMPPNIVLILILSFCSNYCKALDILSVYDIHFDNCSVTVHWEPPSRTVTSDVQYYVVQTVLMCTNQWNNFTVDSQDNSLTIHDEYLVAACLRGDCYFRVVAEVNAQSETSQAISSSCLGIGTNYYLPSSRRTYSYVSTEDQHICIPILSMCPNNLAPNFIVNETRIPWPFDNDINDNYYVSKSQKFCFSKLKSTSTVKEICLVRATCPMCPNTNAGIIVISKVVVQVLSESDIADKRPFLIEDGDEWCKIPILTFDPTSYTVVTNSSTQVCISSEFYYNKDDLQVLIQENVKNIKDTQVVVMPSNIINISSNTTSECVEVGLIGCVKNDTKIELCVSEQINNNVTIYFPMPCIQIQAVTNSTEIQCVSENHSSAANIKIVVSVTVCVIIFIIVLLVITTIHRCRKTDKYKLVYKS